MASKVLTDEDIAKLDAAPELTDEDISSLDSSKPERESRVSTFNPVGLNPASGVIGANPLDMIQGINKMALALPEGFTGGLLKAKDPKTGESLTEGDVLGKSAGFALGPGKFIRSATAPLQGIKAVGPAVRGSVEGLAGGLAFPAEDLDQRISNAKVGALLGATGEVAVTGLTKAWQGFQKFRQAKQALKQLDQEKFNFKGSLEAEQPQRIQLREQRLRQKEKEIVRVQKAAIDEQIKGLSDQLNKESQAKAQAIKEPTLNYMRSFKDEWGQQFDEVLESADTAEQGIKISELQRIRQETIDELTELGIDPKGPVVRTMNRAVNSFKPSQILKEVDQDVIDSAGLPTKARIQVEESGDDIIRNRDLVNVRRNVRGSLSTQAKRGQYTEEDIAQAIFDQKLGEKLGDTLGERFGELNASYKKFSNLSRFAYKNLRPKASEFEIVPGTSLIKKVANGKANTGEMEAVRQLEEFTGIKFTGKASEISSKMDELKNLKTVKVQEIKTKFQRRQAELSRMKREAGKGNKTKLRKIDEEIRANREIVESVGLARRIGENLLIGGVSGAIMSMTLGRLLRRG